MAVVDSFDVGVAYDDRRLIDRGCITDLPNIYNDSGKRIWSPRLVCFEIESNDDRNSWYAFFGSVGAPIIFCHINCSRTRFVSASLPSVNGGGTAKACENEPGNKTAITTVDNN